MWECVVVLVLKLSGRREGARGPSEASAVLLAAGCCCRNELAHARIDPFFRSGTAPNPLRCEKDLGRGSAPEAGHTNTRTAGKQVASFAKPKVPCGVHWSFWVCLRHLGRGAGTGAPFRRTQEPGSPIWGPTRAPFLKTTIRPREISLASPGAPPWGPGPRAEATACLGPTRIRAGFVEIFRNPPSESSDVST